MLATSRKAIRFVLMGGACSKLINTAGKRIATPLVILLALFRTALKESRLENPKIDCTKAAALFERSSVKFSPWHAFITYQNSTSSAVTLYE
jgi:hypothetical protein